MSNSCKVHAGLGLALAIGFALSGCMGAVDAPESSVDEESVGEAESAVTLPPGTKIACTLSGETLTGRRWGYLMVGNDNFTCYRAADPARFGEPAPPNVAHCKGLGNQILCGVVIDL